MATSAAPNARYSVQVLSSKTVDSSPSLLLVFSNARYLFNTPEAISRICIQDKTGMRKVGHVFLGELSESAGLPGFILSTVEAGNHKVEVVGPEGVDHLVASYRFSVRREHLSLKITTPSPLDQTSSSLPPPIHSDPNVVVYAFPLQLPPIPSSPSPLKRKRSLTSPPPSPRLRSPPRPHTRLSQDGNGAFTSVPTSQTAPPSPSSSPPSFDPSSPDFVPSRLHGVDAAKWRQMVVADMFRGQKFLHPSPSTSSDVEPRPVLDHLARYNATRAAPTPSYLPQALPTFPHPPPTAISYLCVGPPLRGKFLVEVAKSKGVPAHMFQRLTRGERVWLPKWMQDEPVEQGKKLPKAEMKAKAAERKAKEASVVEGEGEGTWVESAECMAPGRDGSAFLVLNLPTPEFLPLLAAAITPELLTSLKDSVLQTVFYFLGPGVLNDPRLSTFINSLPETVFHRFSSPDVASTNNIAFGPAALLCLRLSYLSPTIFRLPTYSFLPPPPSTPTVVLPAAAPEASATGLPPTPPRSAIVDISNAPVISSEAIIASSTSPDLSTPTPPSAPAIPDTAYLPSSFPQSSHLIRPTDHLEHAKLSLPPIAAHRSFDFAVPSPTASLEASMLKGPLSTPETLKRTKDLWEAYLPAAETVRAEVEAEERERPAETFPGHDLRVTPLGTGSATPSKYRNVSSTLLHLPGDGGYVLLDAGEGTWGQIARRFGEGVGDGESAEKVLRGTKLVFVSHLHQDHHAGLATVLRERAQLSPRVETPLTIICPPGARMYLYEQQALFDLGLDPSRHGEIRFIDNYVVEAGKTLEHNDARKAAMEEMYALLDLKSVMSVPVLHRCRCWGVVIEHNSGWKAVFSGDTMPCEALVVAGKGATLLIHEATIEDELPEVARDKGHSTFGQAIDIARRMEASHCLLTHFSARYPKLPPLTHSEDTTREGVEPQVAMAFDMTTLRLDEFWKMERFRPVMDLLFGDGEEDEEAGSVGMESVVVPGLTDEEVVSEMRKMTAFIKQEAFEKAREIKVKADEEFAIEKGKIVRQESTNIDANLERKKKQLEIEKKIAISNQNNKSRLTLLESREELLEKVFDEARAKLSETTSDETKYAELLQKLILQALYTIMEKDITVIGRAKDSKLLKKAAASAAKEFATGAGYEIKVEVSEELAAGSAGGVIITGYGNRITVNNTLDERLRLLEERMLPEIRESLFGKNENRRFYS